MVGESVPRNPTHPTPPPPHSFKFHTVVISHQSFTTQYHLHLSRFIFPNNPLHQPPHPHLHFRFRLFHSWLLFLSFLPPPLSGLPILRAPPDRLPFYPTPCFFSKAPEPSPTGSFYHPHLPCPSSLLLLSGVPCCMYILSSPAFISLFLLLFNLLLRHHYHLRLLNINAITFAVFKIIAPKKGRSLFFRLNFFPRSKPLIAFQKVCEV